MWVYHIVLIRYLLRDSWVASTLWHLNDVFVNIHIQVSVLVPVLNSFGDIPISIIAGSYEYIQYIFLHTHIIKYIYILHT